MDLNIKLRKIMRVVNIKWGSNLNYRVLVTGHSLNWILNLLNGLLHIITSSYSTFTLLHAKGKQSIHQMSACSVFTCCFVAAYSSADSFCFPTQWLMANHQITANSWQTLPVSCTNYYWSSPAQSVLVLGPTGTMTIYFCCDCIFIDYWAVA